MSLEMILVILSWLIADAFEKDILLCEAMAVKGLSAASQEGIKCIHHKADSQSLLHMLLSLNTIPWQLMAVITDMLFLLKYFDSYVLDHVSREGNRFTN